MVNEDEAQRVRQIFELYLHHQALIPTVAELAARGWVNKTWTTKRGMEQGGRPFDKTTLYRLLGNRTYTGVVAYQDHVSRASTRRSSSRRCSSGCGRCWAATATPPGRRFGIGTARC